MACAYDPKKLPESLPVPDDGGRAAHLEGLTVPSLSLSATDGAEVDLSALRGRTVVYIYPRTSRPNEAPPEGWDQIPGARGCTAQSCSFRDHFQELGAHGVTRLFGLSTEDSDYQREAVERLHLPFPMLSDRGLRLAGALELPSFQVATMTLLKRMVLVIDDGVITKAFYPVFPPGQSAEEVLAWLGAGQPQGP